MIVYNVTDFRFPKSGGRPSVSFSHGRRVKGNFYLGQAERGAALRLHQEEIRMDQRQVRRHDDTGVEENGGEKKSENTGSVLQSNGVSEIHPAAPK